MRVLALTKYGPLAASMRQRFSQFEPALNEAGISIDYAPLLGDGHLRRLSKGLRSSPLSIVRYYMARAVRLLTARRYDLLWVHCEFFPFMPAVVEKLALQMGGRPVVYDFDDAIFAMYDHASSSLVRRVLSGKLEPLLRAAAACTCGNAYLRDYAAQFCANAVIVPTTVDTKRYRPAERARSGAPVIGWIGSPSTWQYVQPLVPLLTELVRAGRARVLIVGAGKRREPNYPGFEFLEWAEETEITDIGRMDIGIMPLPDDAWARGKSGYKLIQYMACALPVIASPVGVNSEIVSDGENGFLAESTADWRQAIEKLLGDAHLRARMGDEGRRRAVSDYSLQAHAPRVVEIVRAAAASRGGQGRSSRS